MAKKGPSKRGTTKRETSKKTAPKKVKPSKKTEETKAREPEEKDQIKKEEKAQERPEEGPKEMPEPLRVKDLILVLIAELSNKAWAYMEKIAHPETGRPKKDLAQAKLAIDTIESMLDVARTHLNEQEIRSIESTLANLRINFVAMG